MIAPPPSSATSLANPCRTRPVGAAPVRQVVASHHHCGRYRATSRSNPVRHDGSTQVWTSHLDATSYSMPSGKSVRQVDMSMFDTILCDMPILAAAPARPAMPSRASATCRVMPARTSVQPRRRNKSGRDVVTNKHETCKLRPQRQDRPGMTGYRLSDRTCVASPHSHESDKPLRARTFYPKATIWFNQRTVLPALARSDVSTRAILRPDGTIHARPTLCDLPHHGDHSRRDEPTQTSLRTCATTIAVSSLRDNPGPPETERQA